MIQYCSFANVESLEAVQGSTCPKAWAFTAKPPGPRFLPKDRLSWMLRGFMAQVSMLEQLSTLYVGSRYLQDELMLLEIGIDLGSPRLK